MIGMRFFYLWTLKFEEFLTFESANDNFLSTSSMSSRTYGSRDRTFDILDDEDDDEDLFGDDLNVRNKNNLNSEKFQNFHFWMKVTRIRTRLKWQFRLEIENFEISRN